METNNTSLIQKVQITSDLLSFAEIEDICKILEQEIVIEKNEVDKKENERGIDPIVMGAIITASSTVLLALIKAFVRIYEKNKLKGSITIKTDAGTVKIEGEGSAKDMQKWVDTIGKSSIIEQISLLSDKDDDDKFDI